MDKCLVVSVTETFQLSNPFLMDYVHCEHIFSVFDCSFQIGSKKCLLRAFENDLNYQTHARSSHRSKRLRVL